MKNIGAFFDIDGTLVRESILVKHFKKLVKYGIIDEKYWINSVKSKYELFERRYGDFDDYLHEVSEVYREKLEGMDKSLIDFTASQVIEEGGEMVYRYTRERISYHKKLGHKVFFISGSPSFLVEKLAEKYGIDDCRGTGYIFDSNNKFSGKINPMWDSNSKQRELSSIIEQYNIDPEKSYAYGDTNGDFSMLKTMGHASAMNPSRKLLDMIKNDDDMRDKVDIIVERKDVIYKLKSGVEIFEL